MKRLLCLFVAALVVSPPAYAAADSWLETLMRFPSTRETRELERVEQQLAELPLPQLNLSAARGFHSEYLSAETSPMSVTVDMYGPRKIDTIVLVPAVGEINGLPVAGYGFPLAYRIEGSLDKTTWELLHESKSSRDTAVMPIDSGKYESRPVPVFHELSNAAGEFRYLRIRPLRLYERAPGLYLFALSEFMAFDGNSNEMFGGRVETTSSLRGNQWATFRLVDGQTPLGLPADATQAPPALGFHSEWFEDARDRQWVQIDLGESQDIQRLNLIPASPPGERLADYLFPVEFEVELCDDADFPADRVLRSPTKFRVTRTPSPGASIVPKRINGWAEHRARYVRIYVNELAARENRTDADAETAQHGFCLAEVEVIANGETRENVALGKPVTVSCEPLPGEGWSATALTDGYVSQGKRLPTRTYLEKVAMRRRLELSRFALQTTIDDTTESVRRSLLSVLVLMTGLLLLAAAAVVWRSRITARRKLDKLRRQIARDLHDDIGSSLASICIMADLAADDPELGKETANDLSEIRRAATRAGEAMRDIVWLIDTEMASSEELVIHLRGLANQILKGLNTTFDDNQLARFDELAIEVRRSVVLAFKETLNNVRRHANATHVEIGVSVAPDEFAFEVKDDGVGFEADDMMSPPPIDTAALSTDSQARSAGGEDRFVFRHGVRNLKRRAHEGRGRFAISSQPGDGTVVSWSIRVSGK